MTKSEDRVSAEAKPVDKYAEYRRGVREAASLAYLITQNRQGKKAEDVLDRIIKSLSDLADTVAPATPAQSIADTAAGTKAVAWIYREAGKWDVKLGDKPETADKAHPLVFAISNPSAELTAMQERFNLVAAINASYVDEIRALRESIADTAGAKRYGSGMIDAIEDFAPVPAIDAAPDNSQAAFDEDEIMKLWNDLNDARARSGGDRTTPLPVQFARAIKAESGHLLAAYTQEVEVLRAAIDAAGASEGDARDAARMKALWSLLMCQTLETSSESYLTLKCVGMPPTEDEFASSVNLAINHEIAKENGDE